MYFLFLPNYNLIFVFFTILCHCTMIFSRKKWNPSCNQFAKVAAHVTPGVEIGIYAIVRSYFKIIVWFSSTRVLTSILSLLMSTLITDNKIIRNSHFLICLTNIIIYQKWFTFTQNNDNLLLIYILFICNRSALSKRPKSKCA